MTRLAQKPKGLNAVQELIWEHYEADPEGKSLTAMSKAAGMDRAYVQQYLTRNTPRQLPESVRARLSRFLGVPEAKLRLQNHVVASTGDDMDEVELIPKDKAPARLALGPGIELWRVRKNNMAVIGFQVGDYVLVDTRSRRIGSVVATLNNFEGKQRHVFRVFLPSSPRLFVGIGDNLESAETIDEGVSIQGAVIGRYTDLEQGD
jgi:hypothetical protein